MTLSLPDPGDLSDGVIELRVREITAANLERGWVPAYHFTIVVVESAEPVGWLDLRIGSTDALLLYAGHIGYVIDESHRGHRYASRALTLAARLASQNGIRPIWITCNPDNYASRRTCELAGAEYVDTVELPVDNDMYGRGERLKCRYRLVPPDPRRIGRGA